MLCDVYGNGGGEGEIRRKGVRSVDERLGQMKTEGEPQYLS